MFKQIYRGTKNRHSDSVPITQIQITYIRRVVEPQPPIQRRNRLDFLLRQVKRFRVQVFQQSLCIISFGNDSDATLGAPPQDHLRGCLVMGGADGEDRVMLKELGEVLCFL